MQKKRNYNSAIQKYEQALKKIPQQDFVEVSLYLAAVLYANDKLKHSKKVLSQVIQSDPINEDAWYHLAIVQKNNSENILKKEINIENNT